METKIRKVQIRAQKIHFKAPGFGAMSKRFTEKKATTVVPGPGEHLKVETVAKQAKPRKAHRKDVRNFKAVSINVHTPPMHVHVKAFGTQSERFSGFASGKRDCSLIA